MRTYNVDELDSSDRLHVLGIIDQFRELGLNEDISLPQLVVVGDQSSGKSSLLEGLTELHFPVASDLCTRHATQIILRRAPASAVHISIIPGPTAGGDEQRKTHLAGFDKTLQDDDFSADKFVKILGEAASMMGLPDSNADLDKIDKRFSDDVLKIELSGPTHRHLSVVDVPGLFHNPTKYQTEEDKQIIRSLIEQYIIDSRTIILAVLDARNNLANQEVFRMARAADPSGLRTVGIITKCDALQEGDEPGVLKIAQNSVERLNHGWFTVKNRSTTEIQKGVTLKQRHARELNFFANKPWSQLSKDRVGIASLKKFLGRLLYDHVRNEFPSLVKDIEKHVHDCSSELETLGPSRGTAFEQRQYLTRLATNYQRTVVDSLSGNYSNDLKLNDPLKLRMHIQLRNEAFGRTIDQRGQTKFFYKLDGTLECLPRPMETVDETKRDIYDWIRQLYRQSRGAELPGTVNPTVLENLFRQQTKNWETIAREHNEDVMALIQKFNQVLFEKVVTDELLRTKLEARNVSSFNQAREKASNQLDQILRDERGGILQTINHYFADTLSNIREERVIQRLKELGLENGEYNRVDLSAITRAAHLSNEDQAVNDIHDTLRAYYKVALKRFQDNVILQIVERICLGPEGPVKTISPETIISLTDSELSEIAAENYASSSMRADKGYKLERLKKALELAQSVPI